MSVLDNNHNAAVLVLVPTSPNNDATFSVSAGSNLAIVVRVGMFFTPNNSNPPTGMAVTWNGVSMTLVGDFNDVTANNLSDYFAMFILKNPATGTKTLSISWTTGVGSTDVNLFYDLTSYTNVDQTTPARAGTFTSQVNGGEDPASLVVTSAVGDMTTTLCMPRGCSIVGTNKTQLSLNTSGSVNFGTDEASGAATVTHTWDFNTGSSSSNIGGFSIQQAAGGGPTAAQLIPAFTQNGGGYGVQYV